MSPFDVVILAAGLCGLTMAAGGILLLYKGAINLTQTSPDEAVKIEFKKMLNISTRYPALGLFVIGLSFIVTALTFSKEPEVRPLEIHGRISGSEPSAVTVRISAGNWMLQPSSEGNIAQTIVPKMDLLLLEVNAPGYPPRRQIKRLQTQELRAGTAELDDIVFSENPVPKPNVDPRNIAPTSAPLPPLNAPGAF